MAASAPSIVENRDYYLLIDRSGSMTKTDTPSGQTRWEYVQECVYAIAGKILQFDPDGIDIYTFAGSVREYHNVNSNEIIDTIYRENEPYGRTNMTGALERAIQHYLDKRNAPDAASGATFVVITDGEADNKDSLVNAIVEATRQARNEHEFGMSFIQVGHDREAGNFLQYLDDQLQQPQVGAQYDIVNTVKVDDVEEIGLVGVLENAILD